MLAALLSLLLALFVLRMAVRLGKAFFAWLGRGREARWLVKGGYVEQEQAEKIREAFSAMERDALHEMRTERVRLSKDERRALAAAHDRVRDAYLDQMILKWYQLVVIFLVGSFLGLILEEIWMFITAGLTQSRVGLVWGPFSPIYGFGATLLTLVCWELRKHGAKSWQTFCVAMLVGGALEQITGWGMETFLGASSWDYTGVPGALTKWVAIPFLFFWGALGLIWAKSIMPDLLYLIGMPTTARQVVFITLLAVYLGADIFMTVACFGRMVERDAGIPPENAFEQWIDDNYTDRFIAARFQNLVIAGHDEGATEQA